MISAPIRTCLGCGLKGSKKRMLRLALLDGRVVLDKDHKIAGRGVYSCEKASCLAVIKKNRKKLARAFRAVEDLLVHTDY